MTIKGIVLLVLIGFSLQKEEIVIDYSAAGSQQYIAAFFEDVDSQFFADIGGYDPIKFSNTAYLYQKGWTGVQVEANPNLATSFTYIRPETTTVNMAVGDPEMWV